MTSCSNSCYPQSFLTHTRTHTQTRARAEPKAERSGSLSRETLLEKCWKSQSETDSCLSDTVFLFLSPADTNYRSTSPHLSSKSSHPSSGLPW